MSALRSFFAYALVLASAGALTAVIEMGPWFGWGAALIGAFLLFTWLFRALLPRRAGLARPLALLLAALTLFRFAAPSQMIAGVIPGPAAVNETVTQLRQAGEVIQYYPAPVPADTGIVLVALCAMVIVTALVDLLALQIDAPAFAALPVLSLWTPALALAQETPLLLGLATLISWLTLLALEEQHNWLQWRRAGKTTAAIIGAGAAFLIIITGLIPAVQTWHSWQSLEVGRNARTGGEATPTRPIVLAEGVQLSHILAERSNETALRYQTTGATPEVLRLRVMDTYENGAWSPATDLSGAPELPLAKESEFRTDIRSVLQVEHTSLIEQFALSGGNTVGVTDSPDKWRLVPETNELINAEGAITGAYGVVWQQPHFTAADLKKSGVPTDVDPRWLEIGAELPTNFYSELANAKQDATTPYDIAVNIQNWFRSTGNYQYEVTNDEITGAALDDFFITRTGFCTHYATAMTLMLRHEGIPARVAVGFLPKGRSVDGWIEVAANKAHAWPEVYFEDYGWVRFEPTPADQTGNSPAWTRPDATATTDPSASPTQTGAEATASQTPATPDPSTSQPAPSASGPESAGSGTNAWALVSGIGAVTALILVAGGRYLYLARRQALKTTPHRQWDHARKLVTPLAPSAVAQHWSPARSPRQISAALSESLPPPVAQKLAALAAELEQTIFGPPQAQSITATPAVLQLLRELQQAVRRKGTH